MPEGFELHQRLAADTAFVTDLHLSRLLLMCDARYPWLILVPRKPRLSDLDDLTPEDLIRLFREARQASHALKKLFAPDRINVGALGNMVTQLHLHVIARFEGDSAWPGPVWGAKPPRLYDPEDLSQRLTALRAAL